MKRIVSQTKKADLRLAEPAGRATNRIFGCLLPVLHLRPFCLKHPCGQVSSLPYTDAARAVCESEDSSLPCEPTYWVGSLRMFKKLVAAAGALVSLFRFVSDACYACQAAWHLSSSPSFLFLSLSALSRASSV